MWEFSTRVRDSPHSMLSDDNSNSSIFCSGGIFLDSSAIPSSIVKKTVGEAFRYSYGYSYSRPMRKGGEFLCLSLSVKGKDRAIGSSAESAGGGAAASAAVKAERLVNTRFRGQGAMNASKHLCAGAVAAMVSRSAPLVFVVILVFNFVFSYGLSVFLL